jgi:hypothetical protein
MKRLIWAAAILLVTASAAYAAAPEAVTSALDAIGCWFCPHGSC